MNYLERQNVTAEYVKWSTSQGKKHHTHSLCTDVSADF